MRSQSAYLVLGALALTVQAAPQPWHLVACDHVNSTSAACIPQYDADAKARAAAVHVRNAGFVYGPSLIGEAAFFLNGTLGNARVADDMALWGVDREEIDKRGGADIALVQKAIGAVSASFSSLVI